MFIDRDKKPHRAAGEQAPDDVIIDLWTRHFDEWLESGAPSPVPLIPAEVRDAIIRRARRMRSQSFAHLFSWWGGLIRRAFSMVVGMKRFGRRPAQFTGS